MLQKAYEQAKWCLVKRGYKYNHSVPVEVKVAIWKILNNLSHAEIMRLHNGKLTVSDLERFQAPSCKIK